MRDIKELFADLVSFCNSIKTKDYSPLDKDKDFKRFQSLRNEVIQHFTGNPLFNKPIYLTSSFNYAYEDIRFACGEMIQLIMEKGI